MSKKYVPIKELGFNLRAERERRGWSQLDTAAACGISYYVYRGLETGYIETTSVERIEKLRELFASDKELSNPERITLDKLGFDMRERREEMGISQRAIAKQLGVSFPTYQNWENGITKALKRENFEKLKEVFAE